MPEIPANDLQQIAIQAVAQLIPSPTPVDIAPPSGDATPQTHSFAYLTG